MRSHYFYKIKTKAPTPLVSNLFVFPRFLLKFGSAPLPWLRGEHRHVGWWVPEARVRNGDRSVRGTCPADDVWGREGVSNSSLWLKGQLVVCGVMGLFAGELGEWQSLWSSLAFLFFCVCSGRSQGNRKSRSLCAHSFWIGDTSPGPSAQENSPPFSGLLRNKSKLSKKREGRTGKGREDRSLPADGE